MRKEIEELAKTITPETKIEEFSMRVESDEEIKFLLQTLNGQAKIKEKLPDKLKSRARNELKGIPIKELTIPKIQKAMLIGYHNAALIYDWLNENINEFI